MFLLPAVLLPLPEPKMLRKTPVFSVLHSFFSNLILISNPPFFILVPAAFSCSRCFHFRFLQDFIPFFYISSDCPRCRQKAVLPLCRAPAWRYPAFALCNPSSFPFFITSGFQPVYCFEYIVFTWMPRTMPSLPESELITLFSASRTMLIMLISLGLYGMPIRPII